MIAYSQEAPVLEPTASPVVLHRTNAHRLKEPVVWNAVYGGYLCVECYGADYPSRPAGDCYFCRHYAWYERAAQYGGGWICGRCHPVPAPFTGTPWPELPAKLARMAKERYLGPRDQVYELARLLDWREVSSPAGLAGGSERAWRVLSEGWYLPALLGVLRVLLELV